MRLPSKLILFVLLACASASAQTSTTGTIEGLITDRNQAVVPRVTVTASSPNLIRPQSCSSEIEAGIDCQLQFVE